MKTIYKIIIASIYLVACHSTIKHDEVLAKPNADSFTTTTVKFPEPDANLNTTIDKTEDLIGYWAGSFYPSHDSADEVDDDDDLANSSNKINVSIDSITGNKVTGHTVLAGKTRKIYGEYALKDTIYEFNLQQPGDDKDDGSFKFSVNANDSIIKGRWVPFKKDSLIKHEYELKKRFFAYNPSQKLESGRYGDWKKTKTIKIGSDSNSFQTEGYLSTSDDLFKYNPSETLLTAAQVSNLKKADIIILRNSIYARHGFAFKRRQLSVYFDNQDWYLPVYENVGSELTDIEKKNIALLMEYEKNAKEYYDKFGRF